MNAVPIPARAAATNRQDTIVIFHCAELDVVAIALFHNETI
jgi:hypothetical protein